VANESARGLMDLTLQGLSIGNGILTCENMEQARARVQVDAMNKGGAAAEAALRLIEIERTMKKRGKQG
jgi:6,7-dimethyl-8-ribityllumazine synthase